jgi:polyisoprenyl-phosphate glycosyltransferase
MKPKISIVVPVYNSEGNLRELVRQIGDALACREYRLILANDRSRDHSWDIIRELCAADSRVVGVSLRKNSGQDNAIMAGFRYADGEYVVIMDDDLQHSPYDIEALVNACESEGVDVCYASFAKKNQSWWKNLGSWLNGKIAESVIGKPRDVYLSPFKAVRKAVIDDVVKYEGPYPYVDGLLFSVTSSIAQIDVEHHSRHAGLSNYSLSKSMSVFLKLVTSFSILPLRMASMSGFVSASLGFVLMIYFFVKYFIDGNGMEGWTTLVLLILILGGLILMSLGMIGEYLGRMYLTINKRPQFVVKETINTGGKR